MQKQKVELIKLKAKYEILSELESMFPTNSKHAVLLVIKRKMDQLISIIEAYTRNEKNEFIGNYLQRAMKDHNLPHGIAYYNLLSEKSELAEKAWIRHTKNK